MDTNIRPKLWKSMEQARETLSYFIERADIVFIDPNDAEIILQEKNPNKIADTLRKKGCEVTVVKLGPEGAIAFRKEEKVHVKTIDVVVEDPIGAGDALAGTFLSSLMKGEDLKTSLTKAALAGSLVVTIRGDQENLPSSKDIEDLLKDVEDKLAIRVERI